MHTIVVGASGYIGAELLACLKGAGNALGTSTKGGNGLAGLDLCDRGTWVAATVGPGDCLVVAAAISSPEVCKLQPELARRVNVEGTQQLIAGALDRGAKVIFFSSDTVYGETQAPVDEYGVVRPAGDYAAMKHEVERRFAGHRQFKALRLSYVFSRQDKFTQYLQSCAAAGRVAEVFDPFDRAVIHRADVVRGVAELINQWDAYPQSVINFGGPQLVRRRLFAQALQELAFPSLLLKHVTPPSAFFDARPRVINMVSPVLARLLGRAPTALAVAVRREFEILENT